MQVHADLIAGLGFGDEGKGATVDYLVRQHQQSVVVRYNGGCQAAHNVVTPDGLHHTFSQFGSGTFVPNCLTYLSKYMLVNPLNMFTEAQHLKQLGIGDVFSRTWVDPSAVLITPLHRATNRILELYREENGGRHGSCGAGVGQAMIDYLEFGDDVLKISDLWNHKTLTAKWLELRKRKLKFIMQELGGDLSDRKYDKELGYFSENALRFFLKEYSDVKGRLQTADVSWLAQKQKEIAHFVFEGAQGVLLDQKHGFFPYNTWSDVTFNNAIKLLREINFQGSFSKLGILRAYQTRHGAGPFVTEDVALAEKIVDGHNVHNPWQQQFRLGWLDIPAIKYALQIVGGVDSLVVRGMDQLADLDAVKVCTAYESAHKPSGLFRTEGGQIVGINYKPATDSDQQHELTHALFNLSPVLKTFGSVKTREDVINYAQFIAAHFNTPVSLLGAGRSALDMTSVNPYASSKLA